jgi:hypothetical protein
MIAEPRLDWAGEAGFDRLLGLLSRPMAVWLVVASILLAILAFDPVADPDLFAGWPSDD